jgi:hypothetical protein
MIANHLNLTYQWLSLAQISISNLRLRSQLLSLLNKPINRGVPILLHTIRLYYVNLILSEVYILLKNCGSRK